MGGQVQLLDCTLRDGAYIVDARFGTPAVKGIIRKMQDANIDIIECGWLKDAGHKEGTTFYHVPADLERYLPEKGSRTVYAAMIDWDRYDTDRLPEYDGRSIDAVRVVFPKGRFREGIAAGRKVKEKGYQVYFQAADTLGYSDGELEELAGEANRAAPACLSIVDTFGAMYGEDLERIAAILDQSLDQGIRLGFHSHNNQQLSFALTMQFVELMQHKGRDCIADASLCGMGRGAGNTATELAAGFLNRRYAGNYDMNVILDAIDLYMRHFQENFQWGYSTPYLIAGMYGTHVNNIAYLLENHRTSAKDMRNIIESMPAGDRKKYDYGLLEEKYLDYQNKTVDDEAGLGRLETALKHKEVLLLLPGKSSLEEKPKIDAYIAGCRPVVIGVNAVLEGYAYDYVFFSSKGRYEYARESYPDRFRGLKRIVLSSIKTVSEGQEEVVNFNLLVKRGWRHFDNAGIMCLRLLNRLHAGKAVLAGFDGFGDLHAGNYADASLPYIDPGQKWEELNGEIADMLADFRKATRGCMQVRFLTDSRFAASEREIIK